MTSRASANRDDGAWLSIGALGKATGIPVETLRTWENRYGFPLPRRKPSGHRVYPLNAVPRLRRIAEALARGHRAGQVVGASEEALDQLLLSTSVDPRDATPLSPGLPPAEDLDGLLRLVKSFDADRLTRTLLGDWGRMTSIDFLEDRVAPLIHAVGEGWETGELEIRHEHFLSERVGDLLRSLRMPFDEKAAGPVVILATLPSESHGLGLQMAALALSTAGCRVLYLGTEVPPAQIVSLASDLDARAVALSVSIHTRGAATNAAIRKLRERLPRKTSLQVGGEGAPRSAGGVNVIRSLRELETWGRGLAAGVARASPRPEATARRPA
jgi:methanogenic corrinoid protein MtbC1